MLTKLMPQDEALCREEFIRDEVSYNLIHLIAGSPQRIGLKSPDGRMIYAQSPRGNAWLWISRDVTMDRRQFLLRELVSELGEAALPGVTGEPGVAEQFASCYAEERHGAYRHQMTMESYHAPTVKSPLGVEGRIRRAAVEDTQKVARFLVGFSEDAYGVRANAASQVETAERLIQQGGLYVWMAGSHTVSMANIAHRSPRHGRINAVYTPKEERKKGYASALVADLGSILLQEGLVPMLYADQANPDSNRLYQHIGFTRCGTISDLKFVHNG
ncbi:GNAT family N-acetyltransferase [Paenibacillus sp. FSL H8-0457]|uniref:GNAT family N-acetyltransferase n=1 Tax=unclassified Paenibacillus TaxID=185978 RepID=UPI00017890BA|nr:MULTISPECIES: GNAT family N-acetyltransferase [unclassified Paenibacillus]ACX68316.1 GCN5-related N-acetyltransferase [Paenibacillus sp. Y412MC10]ETT69249.1 GCN5-like N-acetyltransferase [Paenibacillus sp. FSL H8-457]